MDINSIVNLSGRAWSLRILACLHDGVAGRQAALCGATGAPRSAFRASLDHLVAMGLVERNPGHGHPLRPEFVLTAEGRAVAATASRVAAIARDDPSGALIGRAWALPILAALRDSSGFSEIGARIGPLTDRALSQTLKALEEARWVTRRVDSAARPPRPRYTASGNGLRIAEILRPQPVDAETGCAAS